MNSRLFPRTRGILCLKGDSERFRSSFRFCCLWNKSQGSEVCFRGTFFRVGPLCASFLPIFLTENAPKLFLCWRKRYSSHFRVKRLVVFYILRRKREGAKVGGGQVGVLSFVYRMELGYVRKNETLRRESGADNTDDFYYFNVYFLQFKISNGVPGKSGLG